MNSWLRLDEFCVTVWRACADPTSAQGVALEEKNQRPGGKYIHQRNKDGCATNVFSSTRQRVTVKRGMVDRSLNRGVE